MQTLLELKKITKNFHQGEQRVEVLKNVNLSVKSGEQIAILGQSGTGKSTLLSIMAGLDHPDLGTIEVNNQNLAMLDQDELSRFRSKHIGIVFQQYHLMKHLTALENVSIPLELQRMISSAEKAREALSLVGLSHRLAHCPSQLSGGECQRVAIARAMVPEPSIILADEPSGNLDQKTGEEIMGLIFKLCKDRQQTLILVTHNQELAQKCDRTLVLSEGLLKQSAPRKNN
jgi:putative ABC transport system ATP-binding protein